MKTGKKSLIFGTHQFLWHPITVFLAWVKLYGLPNWKELICIIIHDWGYWICDDIEGEKGSKHPEFAATLAANFLGEEYKEFCLYHSRHYAKAQGKTPSKLCYADKLAIAYENKWF